MHCSPGHTSMHFNSSQRRVPLHAFIPGFRFFREGGEPGPPASKGSPRRPFAANILWLSRCRVGSAGHCVSTPEVLGLLEPGIV